MRRPLILVTLAVLFAALTPQVSAAAPVTCTGGTAGG